MENIGPKIGIDGEKEYKKQLQDITQQTKTLGAEMKALKSSFDGEAKTMEQNRQVKAKLNEQIEAQQKKIEILNTQLDRATEKYGEDSTQALKLQENIAKATTALNAMESELKSMPSDLDIVGKKFEEVGGKISSVGEGIQSVGSGLTKGITVPVVGAAAASVSAFKEVDEAMDAIVIKTGATGQALDDMQKSAQNIATSIPTSFEMSANAIGEVNTRFNITGQQLEDLSKQFVEFAEVNKTDVSDSIDETQKALAAYGKGAESAASYLDTVNAVGQQTGVVVSKLSEGVVSNATAFQEMGLDINEAVVFMGALEKSGSNSETVLNGMRKALKNAAADGKPLNEALAELQSTIENGTDGMDGLTAAYDLFGKSGDQIYGAVKNGTLNFKDLATSIGDVSGSVSDTFEATLDPMDQMQSTMNELKLVGADLVTTAGPMLTDFMKGLADTVHTLADAWNGLDENQQQTIIKIAGVAATLGPITSGIGKVTSGVGNLVSVGGKVLPKLPAIAEGLGTIGPKVAGLIPSIGGVVTSLGPLMAAAGPFLIGGAVVAGLVAGGIAIYKNWDTIKEKAGELRDGVAEKWNDIKANVDEGSGFIKEIGSRRIEEVRDAFERNGGGIRGTMAATWEILTAQFKTGFDVMDKLTGGKLTDIKDIFVGKFNDLKNSAPTWGKDIINGLVSGITGGIGQVANAANGVAQSIKDRLHFSEPDVGPLKDFHTYMPDMMKGLAHGMISNIGEVESAANLVAGAIAAPMQSASVSNNYGGFNIVVNAADGQSASDIADEIEARIAEKIARQESVWA